jgi:hypothetical protein
LGADVEVLPRAARIVLDVGVGVLAAERLGALVFVGDRGDVERDAEVPCQLGGGAPEVVVVVPRPRGSGRWRRPWFARRWGRAWCACRPGELGVLELGVELGALACSGEPARAFPHWGVLGLTHVGGVKGLVARVEGGGLGVPVALC